RHLVMPGGVEAARQAIDFLAEDISPDTYINVMAQYRPVFRAREVPEIDRRPTPQEYQAARNYALERGLRLAE
ncbi:MAG: radical SAM protein, partial [Planctomycetes bacterium]|nr:radical SAM protein [Planctomycetota bacterium]